MKIIDVTSKQRDYKIYIENNLLHNLSEYLDTSRNYVIISDDLIPNQYINLVKKACPNNIFIDFPSGEKSKSFEQYIRIIDILQSKNVKKDSCIIALGGGVTGDLSGFIASTYLRGIDYIQIPTSLLAQIDSSVGGKVAINTLKSKNSVGNFYPPLKVLIDPKTLDTLNGRHVFNGISEMIKYGMIYSRDLFNDLLEKDIFDDLEKYIYDSLMIKKYFVEEDEYDKSLRQILNFGHTYGHAYEAYYNFQKYLHGEAIALGMIRVTKNQDVLDKLHQILNKYSLPTSDEVNLKELTKYIKNDKKNNSEYLNLILVDEIGSARIVKVKEDKDEYNW